MMKFLLTIFIASLLFLATATVQAAYAQVFKFELADPSQTINVNDSFQVKILINTAGQQVINGDAIVVFDPAKVTIDSALSGNFFTNFEAPGLLGGTNNKYLITSYELVGGQKSTSVDALFATMNLKAVGSGTTQLSFDCIGNTGADSNINRASDAADIIQCPLTPLNLTIGETSGPTSTPTQAATPSPTSVPAPTATPQPTSTPIPTNTPRPQVTNMPRAGSTEITIAALGIGTLLTVIGILFIL